MDTQELLSIEFHECLGYHACFYPSGSATSGSYWFVAQLNPIAQQTAE